MTLSSDLGLLTAHDLSRICTPLDSAVTVSTGSVDPTILARLEQRGFDQAPVERADRRVIIGLVRIAYLRNLLERGRLLLPNDPEVSDEESWLRIGRSVDVGVLLEKMTRRQAVIVLEESNSSESGHTTSSLGLLTISDLNRQALRGALYSLMAHVETELATLMEQAFPDPWTWIRRLNESHQVTVLGYWELSKRRGVDVGPVAAATLSQLIQVTAGSGDLLAHLGFESRKEFEGQMGGIPDLRNRIMHPVRPLVLGTEDVIAVQRAVSSVRLLAMRAEAYAR